jgi:DNA-binding FrmR family transcriptional regulator
MTDSDAKLDAMQLNVLSRLKKIEGQVRGIQNMVSSGQECEDILVQVRAVTSALKSTTRQILKRYLTKCHEKAVASGEDPYGQLEKTISVLTKFIDG